MDWTSTATTTAAVLAAVATAGAWWAARQAGQAATRMAQIERHRWHAELTPQFDVTCVDDGQGRVELRVALVGPSGLDQLDRILVSIRDDIRGRKPITAGGPTPEEIGQQVWGPYRFIPGVDGADQDGRQVRLLDLWLGDQHPFAMERTRPPSWADDTTGAWWRRYAEQPLRLTLGCYREEYELWTVPLRVEVERPGM